MFNSKSLKCLLVGSLLAISSTAMAATSGTVDMSGTVVTTLTVTAGTAGTGMALVMTPATNRIALVGTITASTNNETGLTITTTDGSLTRTGAASIAYKSTTVVGGGVAPADTVFDAAGTGTTGGGSITHDLYIMYSPAAYQDAGAYLGTITVNVSDNI